MQLALWGPRPTPAAAPAPPTPVRDRLWCRVRFGSARQGRAPQLAAVAVFLGAVLPALQRAALTMDDAAWRQHVPGCL
eukprot:7267786-Prymnesium_polylepis.1